MLFGDLHEQSIDTNSFRQIGVIAPKSLEKWCGGADISEMPTTQDRHLIIALRASIAFN